MKNNQCVLKETESCQHELESKKEACFYLIKGLINIISIN